MVSIYIQSIVDSDEYVLSTNASLSEEDKKINQKMERFKSDFQDYSKYIKHGLYNYIVLNNFDMTHVLGQLEEIISSNVPNDKIESTKKIFVIMSFSEKNHRVFSAIKKAASIVSKDIEVERIDFVKGESFAVTQEIVTRIEKATLIVCDLTDERPNVYFELGYAIGLNKKVIHCAKAGTRIHFDIAHYKTIFYEESFDLQVQIEEEIKYIIG